jgi:hypothetical protein
VPEDLTDKQKRRILVGIINLSVNQLFVAGGPLEKLTEPSRSEFKKLIHKEWTAGWKRLLPLLPTILKKYGRIDQEMSKFSGATRAYVMRLTPKELEIWVHGFQAASEYYSTLFKLAKKFDKSNPRTERLFSRALEIRAEKIKDLPGKNPYPYTTALSDANKDLELFDAKEFDRNFVEYEQRFKTWRNRRRRNRGKR